MTGNGNGCTLNSVHDTLSLSLAHGALTGSGFGCSFAGTMQTAGAGLSGTLTATGCTDPNLSGTYAGVSIHNEDNGAIQVEFEKEASGAQRTI